MPPPNEYPRDREIADAIRRSIEMCNQSIREAIEYGLLVEVFVTFASPGVPTCNIRLSRPV